MANTEKVHRDEGEYNKVRSVPTPNANGYPNNVGNTQTKTIRGTGAATKGTGASKNSQA